MVMTLSNTGQSCIVDTETARHTHPPRRRPAGGVSLDAKLEWVDLRSHGVSYKEIGRRYGYSSERVRQLIGGVPYVRRAPRSTELARQVTAWLEGQGVTTLPALLARFDLTDGEYRTLVRDHPVIPRHLVLSEKKPRRQHYSDDDILSALVEVWTRPGLDLGHALSHLEYARHRLPGQPSVPLIHNRFRGWRAACLTAGIRPGTAPRRVYRREWDDEQLLAGVRRYLRSADRAGERATYLGYERFQKLHGDLASGCTVRNRLRERGMHTWPQIVTGAQRHALLAA